MRCASTPGRGAGPTVRGPAGPTSARFPGRAARPAAHRWPRRVRPARGIPAALAKATASPGRAGDGAELGQARVARHREARAQSQIGRNAGRGGSYGLKGNGLGRQSGRAGHQARPGRQRHARGRAQPLTVSVACRRRNSSSPAPNVRVTRPSGSWAARPTQPQAHAKASLRQRVASRQH